DFGSTPAVRRAWALWSLLSLDTDDGATSGLPAPALQKVHALRRDAAAAERRLDEEIIAARYRWTEAVARDVRTVRHEDTRTWTRKIDDVLTHRVYGMAVFAVVMAVVFEALFTWSEPFMGAIETATAWLQGGVRAVLPEGNLADLLADGVVAGGGNVVVFVPQIAMLSFFIALLEASGYLARVAYVIDRLMGRVGLHGKAFVPMLSGFACAIPAVMATRTIEGRRDRLITMLTLPMISCSARLPVYAIVTAVAFAGAPRVLGIVSAGAVVLFSMYALSVCATLAAAAVLRRTVLKGPRLPLLLELPPYRVPVWSNIFLVAWRRTRKFLEDAGAIILTMTVILWALLSYPHSSEIDARYDEAREAALAATTDAAAQEEQLAELAGQQAGEQLRYSLGGRLGQAIEPTIEPLGFDWRIGVGIIGAFAAREVFVSTLGIVFGIEEADEESVSLRESLQNATHADGSRLMTPLAGVSLMVFFVLACQCMSTIVVVRRESGGWYWPTFMFGYMSVLAYVASLAVYQVGSALGWGV
ncbi:MAG: ferrous iron transport protein B, partial [Acidobacteria bacterium]|nr:ferrous iron transport protein B [Acidobacteriota bacterium]